MSKRREAFTSGNTNPAEKFIEWKSDHQKFAYWDKEKGENGANVFIDLPFRFLALKQLHTVTGFNPKIGSGMFANEVEFLGTQELTVKYFKDKDLIAKGLWNDIKSEVDNHKGGYALSLYVMLEDGSIANLKLKGASVGQWYEFTKKSKSRLYDEWITVNAYGEGKQGNVSYTFPIYEYNNSLNAEEGKLADEAFEKLDEHLQKYFSGSNSQEETASDAPKRDMPPAEAYAGEEDHDDMPF